MRLSTVPFIAGLFVLAACLSACGTLPMTSAAPPAPLATGQ